MANLMNDFADVQRPALSRLFAPSRVAVVGASPNHAWARRAIENFAVLGFDGEVAAVNPKYREVLGFPCAPTLEDLPFVPEVVVSTVGGDRAVDVVEEAARLGVAGVVVFAVGFAEAGDAAGRERQGRVVRAAAAGNMAVVGPNCMGLISFANRAPLYIDSVLEPYTAGGVALISQSGSVMQTLVNNKRGVRFSHVVSVGNEAVTDTADLVGFLAEDEATDVITLFLETIRSPDRFFEACERARDLGKPVVVLKAGRTEASAAAAQAHTGALAVPDRLVDARLKRHGVVRVDSFEELLMTALAVQAPHRVRGPRVATISESGGQVELALDAAEPLGLRYPAFAPATEQLLLEHFPTRSALSNPLDAWGMQNGFVSYPKILAAAAADEDVDMLLIFSDFTSGPVGEREKGLPDASEQQHANASGSWTDQEHPRMELFPTFELLEPVAAGSDKVVAVIGTIDGIVAPERVIEGARLGITVLSGIQVGLKAIANLVTVSRPRAATAAAPELGADEIAAILQDARAATGGQPALDLIAAAGIPTVTSRLADDVETAVGLAAELGHPVVMKPGDPQLTHKTESGLVFLDVADEVAARRSAETILASSTTVSVQERVGGGVELILGLQSHEDLGMFVVVGMGGIWTEIVDDAALRPVGLLEGEAEEMLRSLRGFPVLEGARGGAAIDIASVVAAIERLDAIGRRFGDVLEAIDVNPLIAGPDGVTAVDALIVPRRIAAR